MSAFPGQPRLLRGGIVLVDIDTAQVLRVDRAAVQPGHADAHAAGAGRRPARPPIASRRCGSRAPPIETIKLEAEIDATDQLEFPDQNPTAVQSRHLHPQLAALETIVYPTRAADARRPTSAVARRHDGDRCRMAAPLHAVRLERQRGSCRCASPISASPRRRSTAAQPDPRQGQPGPARAARRRPRLRQQGRQPLHDATMQQKERLAKLGRRRAVDARHCEDCRDRRRQRRAMPFPPTSRYAGLDRRSCRRPTAATIVYLRRRFLPAAARRSRVLQTHTVVEGDRLDNIAAALHRRSRAVLAHLRRQQRACDPDDLCDDRRARPRITLPQGVPGPTAMLKGFYLTLLIGPVVPSPVPRRGHRRRSPRRR